MTKRGIKKLFLKFRDIPVDLNFLRSFRAELGVKIGAGSMLNPPSKTLSPRYVPFSFGKLVPAFLGIILILGGSGTVFASQKSLPGEILYPVKLFTENVRLAAVFNPISKAKLQLELAEERVKELGLVLDKNNKQNRQEAGNKDKDIEQALQNLRSQLEGASFNAKELKNSGDLDKALEVNSNLSAAAGAYKNILERSKENVIEDSLKDTIDSAANAAGDIKSGADREIENIDMEKGGGVNGSDQEQDRRDKESERPENTRELNDSEKFKRQTGTASVLDGINGRINQTGGEEVASAATAAVQTEIKNQIERSEEKRE